MTLPQPHAAIASAGSLNLRVRYCECDPMGVVHHAAFIPWLEMGRTELLRSAGVSYAQLEAAGVFLVIVKLDVSYKRPGYYDDCLEVRTRVVGGSRIKIRHEYEIVRIADPAAMSKPANHEAESSIGEHRIASNNLRQNRAVGETIITGSTLLASVDRTGRPTVLPEWLVPATRE